MDGSVSRGLTLHCKLSSSLAHTFLQLLHGNSVCGGYFAVSAQRGKEEDGAVECSERISNLMALRGRGRGGGGSLVVLGVFLEYG